MSRDLEERLRLFSRDRIDINFRRIALNMKQVKEQNPPPNPAKTTDSRYAEYRAEYGELSWELDALSPEYLHKLVEDNISAWVDPIAWEQRKARIERVKHKLQRLADNFDEEEE